MKIAIIDYGMGNLHSVYKALAYIAPEATIYFATTATDIAAADRLILPGQGAIKACMENIRQQNIEEAIKQAAREKPFLGICIGPQLMMTHSEENGGIEGLNLFDGNVIRFKTDYRDEQNFPIKIPHMGWNTITQTVNHPLWNGIPDNSHFYYVHSYHLSTNAYTIGETTYGITYPAAIAKENIAGLQAHPEKSSHTGLQFLANFVDWHP